MDNLAGGSGAPHDRNMEASVAVLEEIAAATKDAVVALRQEARETNQRIDTLRGDVTRVFTALRDVQERDFRIMFGALITTALGLAALMVKGFHWF